MATSKDGLVSVSAPENNLCKSCSRSTKSDVKCIVCKAAFHPSCAVRVTGMKVVGFNELCCPLCEKSCEKHDDAGNLEDDYQRVVRTNETLNVVILRLMDSQDSFRGELEVIREKLCQLTSLHTDEVQQISRQSPAVEPNRIRDLECLDARTTSTSEVRSFCQVTADIRDCQRRPSASGRQRQRRDDDLVSQPGDVADCTGVVFQGRRADITKKRSPGRKEGSGAIKKPGSGGVCRHAVDPKAVSAAVHEAVTRAKCQELITLGKTAGEEDGEWKIVPKRRGLKAKNRPVVGDMEHGAGSVLKLRAAARKAHFHVYRLAPGTSEEDVVEHLRTQFPEVECEALKSRYPAHYSSFKITVNFENAAEVMKASCWPKGACINRFFQYRTAPKETG